MRKCKDKGTSIMSNSTESCDMLDMLSHIPTDPNMIKIQVENVGRAEDVLAIPEIKNTKKRLTQKVVKNYVSAFSTLFFRSPIFQSEPVIAAL